jgi:PKD repeat protein
LLSLPRPLDPIPLHSRDFSRPRRPREQVARFVALSGIATNCTVTNSNPMRVNVLAGGTGRADFAISSTALPPPVDHAPVVNAGGNQTVLVGSFTLNASFTDQDNDGPWSYSIDWGDGSSESGIAQSPGPITRSHSYGLQLLGSHTVTVTVTDAHNLSGSASAVITIVSL